MFINIKYGECEPYFKSLAERNRILNFIEESAQNDELNILWYGFGGEVLKKEDKNLFAFYVKE